MFSRVSQKVMPQPPSANKKKNYEIQEVLGTGSFGKVMVGSRLSFFLHSS
jgi:calcium/calmodulin-dependent protein kinase I